jgi:hypothetical protein
MDEVIVMISTYKHSPAHKISELYTSGQYRTSSPDPGFPGLRKQFKADSKWILIVVFSIMACFHGLPQPSYLQPYKEAASELGKLCDTSQGSLIAPSTMATIKNYYWKERTFEEDSGAPIAAPREDTGAWNTFIWRLCVSKGDGGFVLAKEMEALC